MEYVFKIWVVLTLRVKKTVHFCAKMKKKHLIKTRTNSLFTLYLLRDVFSYFHFCKSHKHLEVSSLHIRTTPVKAVAASADKLKWNTVISRTSPSFPIPVFAMWFSAGRWRGLVVVVRSSLSWGGWGRERGSAGGRTVAGHISSIYT